MKILTVGAVRKLSQIFNEISKVNWTLLLVSVVDSTYNQFEWFSSPWSEKKSMAFDLMKNLIRKITSKGAGINTCEELEALYASVYGRYLEFKDTKDSDSLETEKLKELLELLESIGLEDAELKQMYSAVKLGFSDDT